MNTFLRNITKKQLTIFFCMTLIVSLIYSKFVLSVSMIAFIVLSLFNWEWDAGFPIKFNDRFEEGWKRFSKYKAFPVLTIFFFLVLISILYSEDAGYLLERLRLKLPFLILPVCFAVLPAFSKREYFAILYFLVIVVGFSCVITGFQYWADFDNITGNMRRGHAIPTPMNHIRYSLMIAFTIITGIWLLRNEYYLKFKSEKYLLEAFVVFLFLFMHVLSVRSGLLALYLSLMFFAAHYIYQTKNYIPALVGIGVLALIPLIAYQTIPSFKNKVDYTMYDMKMHRQGTGEHYSDSERLISLKVGMAIGNEHKVIGVGAGDLKKEVRKVYETDYPMVSKTKMPHNQFVSVYAGSGIIGLSFFVVAFFFPLCYKQNYKDPLLVVLHLIVLSSFMMENTIENAIGIAFYIFFLLISLNYHSNRMEAN